MVHLVFLIHHAIVPEGLLDNWVHLFDLLMKFEVEKQFSYILKFGTWKNRKLMTIFSFNCPNHLHYLVYVCELTFKYLWMSLLSYSHLEAFMSPLLSMECFVSVTFILLPSWSFYTPFLSMCLKPWSVPQGFFFNVVIWWNYCW
jgi:hypothetical protein